jgi:propionyl-CoA carboxylase alpha chain
VETFELDGSPVRVGWRRGRSALELVEDSGEVTGISAGTVEPVPGGWRVVVEHDGLSVAHEVLLRGDRVDVESPAGHFGLTRVPRFVDPADVVAQGSLLAPMPGTVIGVPLEAGTPVTAGQPVLVLEAMKMQHTITAPSDGVLSEIAVSPGQQVSAGEVLAVVTEPDPSDPEGDTT